MTNNRHWVLAVDDDQKSLTGLARAICWMGLGYNATTSRQEALRTFLTDPSLIDVVVASITVPCARELQIVEMVCGIDPHMPIVLMSRPSHIPELVIRTRYLGKVRILPKPAPMESLQKSLSKALAARYP